MDEEAHHVTAKFTEAQARYLDENRFLSPDLQELLGNAVVSKPGWWVLRLDPDTAERFCDEFFDQLAFSGFRPDDEPNAEGLLLEDLIDRFNPAE